MRSRSVILSLTLLAVTSGLYALAPSDSYVGSTAVFSIGSKTGVPGKTLTPGQYAIIIVDQYSDRMLVRVQNETTKEHVIFLGVPQSALGAESARGPVEWKNGPGNSPALRGFAFSPRSGVEFVYPKSEAVQIATQNSAKVIAVDPDSESMPPVSNMSKDDIQMVSLWALSLTPVGPKDKGPAIAAKKYQGEQIDTAQAALAKSAASQAEQPREVATLEQPNTGVQAASPTPAKRRPVIAKLPHTASPVAFIAFCGMFCLMAAGILRAASMLTTLRLGKG
jgi:hypothetical protein